MRNRYLSLVLCLGLALLTLCAHAAPPANSLHIRGVVQSFKGRNLSVLSGGKTITVQLAAHAGVLAVLPSSRAHIKDGSFLGITSVPGPGGVQQAREVVVLPESMRGRGEGSYPWDLPGSGGHSKMTNGTVGPSNTAEGSSRRAKMTNGTVHQTSGSALTVVYKSGGKMGEQHITLPPGIPVVTVGPGSPAMLKPGAHVFVLGQRQPNGSITAGNVLVGKNGLVLPM